MSFYDRMQSLINYEETSRVGKRWTVDEDNRLVEELETKTYEEIALEHKRTITAIKSRVISHIIYPKYKETIEDNIEEIAIAYNIDNELIIKYINKINNKETINNKIKNNKETINNKIKNNKETKSNKTEINKTEIKQILEHLEKIDNKVNDLDINLSRLYNKVFNIEIKLENYNEQDKILLNEIKQFLDKTQN
jgi:hypothetical protein